jgi:hypothetical protein
VNICLIVHRKCAHKPHGGGPTKRTIQPVAFGKIASHECVARRSTQPIQVPCVVQPININCFGLVGLDVICLALAERSQH